MSDGNILFDTAATCPDSADHYTVKLKGNSAAKDYDSGVIGRVEPKALLTRLRYVGEVFSRRIERPCRPSLVDGSAVLPAGTAIGYHTHPGDEAGYVLKGTLILKTRGQPDRVLKAGDSFFNPLGAVHSLVAAPGEEGGTSVSAWIIDKASRWRHRYPESYNPTDALCVPAATSSREFPLHSLGVTNGENYL